MSRVNPKLAKCIQKFEIPKKTLLSFTYNVTNELDPTTTICEPSAREQKQRELKRLTVT